MIKALFQVLSVTLLGGTLWLGCSSVQADPPPDKDTKSDKGEVGKGEPGGKDKFPFPEIGVNNLATLEPQAAAGVRSTTINGVTLGIELKAVPNKEFTDIEVAWTLTYSGPRPPLIMIAPTIVRPSLGQTTLLVWAVPKGKDTGFPCPVSSPSRMAMGGKWVQIGPYAAEMKDLGFPPPIHSTLPINIIMPEKDWFVTVPAGKSVRGIITLSGEKLKQNYLKWFPGEFDLEQAPRYFVELRHMPFERGLAHDLDAWVGDLRIPANEVPGVGKW